MSLLSPTHLYTHTHARACTRVHLHAQRLVGELVDDDYRTDDGIEMQPSEVFSYLSRVMYNRRSKFNPLWNSLVVGGVDMEGKPFLVCLGFLLVLFAALLGQKKKGGSEAGSCWC